MATEKRRPRRTHRRGAAYADDGPMVPISGERVKAAITQYAGISVNEAAKKLNLSQSTLDSIINKVKGKCHQRTRDKIADLVGLPGELLEEGTMAVGALLDSDRLLHTMRPVQLQEIGLPAASEFAMYRVGLRIANAWRRDQQRGTAPPVPYPPYWDQLQDEEERFSFFCELFLPHIFSLWRWRHALIEHADIEREIEPKEWDAFGVALADAIEALLKPWLDDHGKERQSASLNYERFHKLLFWLADLPPAELPPIDAATEEANGEHKPKRRQRKRKQSWR